MECFMVNNIIMAHSFSVKTLSCKQWSFGTLGTAELPSGSIHLSMLQRLKDINCSTISHLEIYRRSITCTGVR